MTENNFIVTLDRLVSLLWDEDETEEDRPSIETFKQTWELLRGVYSRLGDAFPRATVSSFCHTIRVEWGKPGVRGVRLTVAPEGKRSYIYHEEQDDYSALDDISEDSLAKWLRWLAASSPVTSGHYFLRKKPMCSRQFYYILGGLDSRTPVAVDEETYESWVRSAHRKVAVTAVAEGVDVSTFFMSPRPTFETTVFGGKLDGVLIKTESWDAAEAAHQAMVERVREAEGNPVPPVEEGWQRTEWFCRYCGKQPLDVEVGEGDYYQGPTYWCRSCDAKFTMG